ncbi:hypothetical protein ARTHROSP310_35760 [Arthrobacter sp. AD-310]
MVPADAAAGNHHGLRVQFEFAYNVPARGYSPRGGIRREETPAHSGDCAAVVR